MLNITEQEFIQKVYEKWETLKLNKIATQEEQQVKVQECVKLSDYAHENKATIENVTRWWNEGYQVLVLGHARSGKTFLMKNIWQSIEEQKVFLTHTHACRYKFIEQVTDKYIYDTTVFAAIEVDKTLINRQYKFIDEIGLFSNNQFNAAAWFANLWGNIIMTADVHQIVNSDFLHCVVMTALQNKINSLEEYNQLYCLKDELKIDQNDVNKYHSNLSINKIKILYADFKQNRHIMNDFEANGLKNFIVENNDIEFLKSEIAKGVQIITPCIQDRDFLINSISPSWVKNLKVGERVYCKKNEDVNRNRRKWWNGVYYTVSQIDVDYVTLNKENITDNEQFNSLDITVNKAIFSEYFQPPYAICVAKGQGSDFKDVILYINEKSASCLTFNIAYCAASRARETFKVVVSDKSLLNTIEAHETIVRDLTNTHKSVDTIKIKQFISSFAQEFNNKSTISYYTDAETKYKDYNLYYQVDNKVDTKDIKNYTQLCDLFNKKYNLNITYKQFMHFSKDVTFKNLAIEQPKVNKNNSYLISQVLMSLRNGTTPYSSNRYIKQVSSKIDYKSSKVTTEPDWEKFKKIELAEIWYISYYSLGLYLQTLNDKLTFNDYFALITLRLCFDEELTRAWENSRDKYERNLQNALDNYVSETSDKVNHNHEHTTETKHNKTYQYEKEISGRYSPVFNNSNTLPTSKDWLTEPVENQLNAYNLYNTEYTVIDIDNYVPNFTKTDEDGETQEIDVMHELIKNFEGKAPIFHKTVDNEDDKHKYSCHIWIRTNFKAPRQYFKFGEVLSGAHSQPVYLKTNKYPANFKVSDIENLIPDFSANQLDKLFEMLNLYKDDKVVKLTDYEVNEEDYINYELRKRKFGTTDKEIRDKYQLMSEKQNDFKQSGLNIVDYLKSDRTKLKPKTKPKRNYYDY